MSELIIQATTVAQWHTVVNEAELNCSLELGEELESYLVFLLMRFTGKPEMVNSIVAIDFLQALHIDGKLRHERLRDVGDKCLIFSGLFPELANRRRLNVSYFIDLGQNAYYLLSGITPENMANLYSRLCESFVMLKNVLQALRETKHPLTKDEWLVLVKRSLH